MVVGGSLLLAHPLTEAVLLPVPPVVLAAAAAGAVVVAASFGPAVRDAGAEWVPRTAAGPLSRPAVVGRGLAMAVLVAAVVVGRVGPLTTPRNLAPIVLVAVGWPLLVLGSAVLGPIWKRIDPFDGFARLLRAPDGAPPPPDRTDAATEAAPDADTDAATDAATDARAGVWPAAAVALLVVGYVVAYPDGVLPRTLALVAAGYLLVMLAGCLALGRRTWLEQVEPIGLLLTWIGGLRRGRLRRWVPPAGSGALLGVVGGGLAFGLARGTELWIDAAAVLGVVGADLVGLLLFALLGAVVVEVGGRGQGRAAVAAAVPVVAGLALAYSLRGGRLIIGLDVLPGLLVDPLGAGWTVAGIGARPPNVLPFDAATLALIQVSLILLGGVAGARVIRHRLAEGRPWGAIGVVTALVMAGVIGTTVA